MTTSTHVRMDVMDTTAKDDASLGCTAVLMPFADPEDLLREAPVWPKYMTLEPDRFVLDGGFVPMPDNLAEEQWGVYGGVMSGAAGVFPSPIVLDYRFTAVHTCVGLTFHFDPAGGWPGDMLVQWYDEKGTELVRMRVAPTAHEWFLNRRVARFVRVVVTVFATSEPYRYCKIAGLEFGRRRLFGPEEINEARVVEQLDPTAASAPAGELDLLVYCPAEDFALLDAGGLTGGLQQRQRFLVYTLRDGIRRDMGTYYLSEWTAESEQRARFAAVDAVGLLEAAAFEGGVYGTTAGVLAAQILEGFAPFTIDAALAAQPVAGWLPACTRRDALAQLAFALGAVVDTSRDGVVKLYRAAPRPEVYIRHGRKVLGASALEVKPLVTAVRVSGHSYTPGAAAEAERLFSGGLAAGRHTVRFSSPASGFWLAGGGANGNETPAGCEIVRQHPNFVVLVLARDTENVEVWGVPYLHAELVAEREAEDLPPDATENLLEVSDATLVSPALAGEVCGRLLNYHAQRYRQSFRLRPEDERLADTVQVASFSGQKLRGGIESLEIDLAGGFVADCVMSGVRVDADWEVYCGEPTAGNGLAGVV